MIPTIFSERISFKLGRINKQSPKKARDNSSQTQARDIVSPVLNSILLRNLGQAALKSSKKWVFLFGTTSKIDYRGVVNQRSIFKIKQLRKLRRHHLSESILLFSLRLKMIHFSIKRSGRIKNDSARMNSRKHFKFSHKIQLEQHGRMVHQCLLLSETCLNSLNWRSKGSSQR